MENIELPEYLKNTACCLKCKKIGIDFIDKTIETKFEKNALKKCKSCISYIYIYIYNDIKTTFRSFWIPVVGGGIAITFLVFSNEEMLRNNMEFLWAHPAYSLICLACFIANKMHKKKVRRFLENYLLEKV